MKLKRLTAFILSLLTITLPLSSCNNTADQQSGDQLLTNVFHGNARPIPEDYILHTNVTPYYDEVTGNITCGASYHYFPSDEEGMFSEKHLLTISPDGTLVEDIILSDDSNSYVNYGVISADSYIYLTNMADGDTGEQIYKIKKYDRNDGTLTTSDDISPLFEETASGNPAYINDIAVDAEGYYYVSSYDEIIVLDENFIRQFSVFTQDTYLYLTPSPDGQVYIHSSASGKVVVTPIDKNARSLGTPITCGDLPHVRAIYFTDDSEKFDMYYSDENGLHGMNFTDGTHEQVMDLKNSGIPENGFYIMSVLDENNFIAAERDQETFQYSISVYSKGADVDLSTAQVIEIALASGASSELTEEVVSFNKANPEYRVIVTDYSKYNTAEDPNAGMTKLTTDILNGIYKPDIVAGDPMDTLMRTIVENELYTDLYTFIDKDETISRDDLLGAYTSSFDDDGRLWGICKSFDIMTMIVPTYIIGERDGLSGGLPGGWTFTEALDFASSLPAETALFDGITQMVAPYAIFGLSGYGAFIDSETNTAHFDSADFINYLEYLTTLPADIDYTSLPSDYASTAYLRRRNGQVALYPVALSDTTAWIGLETIFGTKDFTLIGYPTASEGDVGSYAYASDSYLITNCSEYPDAAWSFLRGIVTEEIGSYLSGRSMSHDGFPIFKSALDKLTEPYTAYEYIYDPNGNPTSMSRYDPESPASDESIPEAHSLVYFTEEDRAALKEFIDTSVGSPWVEMVSDEITAIVNEEISAYLAGTRGAEETADIVQSRVSIWLAEHE